MSHDQHSQPKASRSDTAYRIPDHVKAVIDADGAVLLDIRQGKYFSMNAVAVEIWQQLELGRTIGEIEQHLFDVYDAPHHTLQQDMRDFLDELESGQLVDVHV